MNNYVVGFGIILILLFACENDGKQADGFIKPNSDKTEIIDKKYKAGESVYKKTCMPCHQANGEGMGKAFPPLANSDYLLSDKHRAISQVIHGSEGEITVNGTIYSGIMAPQGLNNKEVRDVINYVLNSWGNNGGEVTINDVEAQRALKR